MPDFSASTTTPPADKGVGETPFVIVLHQRDRAPSGTFRPEASVTIRPALCTSGLLAALPPEDVKSLLLLLTFVTANGWCRPTAAQIAAAMGVGEGKARSRLGRLGQFRWQGRPLVAEVPHEGGQDSFVPSPTAVGLREEAPAELAPTPPVPTAGRAAIVAHTRAAYARPRAEVERMIAEQMGWGPPSFEGEDPAVAEGKRRAYKAMTDVGVPKDQALDLLGRHDLGRVERQLTWLPLRRAKTPARFLVAAVENDYEPPVAVRLDLAAEQAAAPGDVPQEDAASPLPADESGRP